VFAASKDFHQASCRRAAVVRDPDFQAVPELVEALEQLDEKKFRYLLNEDAMATEKTAEGIRKFVADMAKLEKVVASKIN